MDRPLPQTHWRWELTAAGLDALELREVPVPRPGPDELLVRIDACGVCFSDIKIVRQGGQHPRLTGRDLQVQPVVMGHEAAMTVVDVGANRRGQFSRGQRFLIQADVYSGGVGMAFGYRLPGGYCQYQIIGPEVLNGDEGCYLIPVPDGASRAQAALCEPWACVEASYCYEPRREPLPGGRPLLVLLEYDEITELQDEIRKLRGAETLSVIGQPWLRRRAELPERLAEFASRRPRGFDDILIYGRASPPLITGLSRMLSPGGVLAIQDQGPIGPAPVDIGSVHYRKQWFTGSPMGDVYAWNRSTELQPGGIAWFAGAGGPLGQMHIQRALSLPDPPETLIVTQNGGPRLDELDRRFAPPARERGIDLILIDPKKLGDGVGDAVRRASRGHGCDDIVVIVPIPEVVEEAYRLLAPGGGLNLFAGVGVGTTAELDLGRIASDGVRMWGTSGSTIADLRRIVGKLERGELATDRVVAAVGGIRSVRQALEAVRDGLFLGKTLIYPHCRDLPLLTVQELSGRHPEIRERLVDGRYWSPTAEEELHRIYA